MAPTDQVLQTAKRALAVNVASIRAGRGWSQQELADAAGLDLKHLQKIEYGSLNPSLRTLVRIASAFRVSVGRLLTPSRSPLRPRRKGRPRRKP